VKKGVSIVGFNDAG